MRSYFRDFFQNVLSAWKPTGQKNFEKSVFSNKANFKRSLFFFLFIFSPLSAVCSFSANEMRLYTIDEWLEKNDSSSPRITEALRKYHESSLFTDTLETFIACPGHYFEKRMQYLNDLIYEIDQENLTPLLSELKKQAGNKYTYLQEVPVVLNPKYIQSFVFKQIGLSKDLAVQGSYWFEIFDPLHRAGNEIRVRLDKWSCSAIPSFFIFLETTEYDPGLNHYAPFEHQVIYLDENQRKKHQMDFYNGKLYFDGEPFSTNDYLSKFPEARQVIYVLGHDAEFYIMPHLTHTWHHSTPWSASSILDAGSIIAEEGQIIGLCNTSGHYMPSKQSLLITLNLLGEKIGSLAPIQLKVLEFDPLNGFFFNKIIYNAEEFLKANGFAIPTKTERGWRALHAIAWNNDVDHFALVNKPAHLNKQDKRGHTPLHLTVIAGSLECAELLLQAGARTDLRTVTTGETPLHLAIRRGQQKLVDLLLRYEADLFIQNNAMENPLLVAARHGTIEMFELLFNKYSAEFSEEAQWTLFKGAVQNKQEEIYDLCFKRFGSKVLYKKDESGNTLMHFAATNPSFRLIKRLLNHGLSLDVPNTANEYPLHTAAAAGASTALHFILKQTQGIHVQKKDILGEDPLKKGIAKLTKKALLKLLYYKPDFFDRDLRGMTALHHAAQENSVKARRNLTLLIENLNLSHHTVANLYEENGLTPLHLALVNNSYLSTYWLMALLNAENIPDASGKTLVEYAKEIKNEFLAEFVIEKLLRP